MASENLILEKLNAINDKAQAANSLKLVLLNLIDFVHEFNKPSLQPIIKAICDEDKEDHNEVNELRNKTWSTQTSYYKDLCKYFASNKICLHNFDWFAACSESDPQKLIVTSRDPIVERQHDLQYQFQILAQISSSHYAFISKYTIITCPTGSKYHPHIDVILRIPTYVEWLNKIEALSREMPTKVYYHWNYIAWIYKAVKEENASDQDCPILLERCNTEILKQEILDTIAGKGNPLSLVTDELKYSLQKVLDYCRNQSELTNITKEKQTNIKDNAIPFSYDSITKILTIQHIKIQLREGRPAKVLEILIKYGYNKKTGTWKELSWDFIFEKMNGTEPLDDVETKQAEIFEAGKGINKLKALSGMPPFLIVKKRTLCINQKYKLI
jgi:hypothetical protein